jgi:tripartite-type tricarboxylate transporter receptor subunit TctC
MLNRRLTMKCIATSGVVVAFPSVFAQSANQTSSQPAIRILVGAPAGGSTDTMARAISVDMGKALGRTVVVENKPGAGGNIAAEAVAKAIPDGNTLLMSFTSHAINASLYPSLPFNPVTDFTPLTCVSTSPSMLVVHPSVKANDLKSFIGLAKSNPGKFNFAIGALGSSLHMAGDAFKMQANLFIVNIPYRGTAPAVSDVLAGQVEAMFAAVGNVQQHVKAGKLRALGVTSALRLSAFPDVPTIGETLKGFESSAWFGLFGPARLPIDVASKLGDAARTALRAPEVRRRLETEGAITVGNSSQEFSLFVQSEISRWAKVVKYSGAKPE